MASSATRAIQNRPNLHGRQRESTSQHVLRAFLVIMTLISFARGIVLHSGVRRYRVAPFVRPQTALGAVARTRADALSSSSTGAAESLTPSAPEEPAMRKPWKTLFDLKLPEGRCLGLRIDASQSNPSHPDALSTEAIATHDHWIHACLHPAEVDYALKQPSEYAQQTFLLGRLAMRQVLEEEYDAPILRDAHGRPGVPPNYLGSISHKRSIADGTTGVALLSPRVEGMGVGVDIEQAFSRRRSIGSRILTQNELNELGNIEVRGMVSADVLAFFAVAV